MGVIAVDTQLLISGCALVVAIISAITARRAFGAQSRDHLLKEMDSGYAIKLSILQSQLDDMERKNAEYVAEAAAARAQAADRDRQLNVLTQQLAETRRLQGRGS